MAGPVPAHDRAGAVGERRQQMASREPGGAGDGWGAYAANVHAAQRAVERRKLRGNEQTTRRTDGLLGTIARPLKKL